MNTLYLIVLFSLTVGSLVNSLKWSRLGQREHYIGGSVTRFYFRWVKSKTSNYMLFILLLICGIISLWIAYFPFIVIILTILTPIGLTFSSRTSKVVKTERLSRVNNFYYFVIISISAVSLVVELGYLLALLANIFSYYVYDQCLKILANYEKSLSQHFVDSASQKLKEMQIPIVAITGSYSKTTTKNVLNQILNTENKIFSTKESFNNRLGIAKAINEDLNSSDELAIVEMGTYGIGEIREMCSWVKPHISVITGIAPVHLERMKNLENILDAKSEIVELAGSVVINGDDELLLNQARTWTTQKIVYDCSTTSKQAVVFVDYKDGVMADMLKSNEKITLIEFKDGQPTETVKDTTVIMQSILPNTVRPELNLYHNTKILFWTLFHYNLVPDFLPVKGLRQIHHNSPFFKGLDSIIKKKYYKNLNLFVRKLHEKSSIYFMDNSTYEITNDALKLNISDPNIIPICIGESEKNKNQVIKQDKPTFNVCWVGRIEDFKTSILQYSINEVKRYADHSGSKIQYNIIGYGRDVEKVKSNIGNSEHFTANFIGEMNVNSLNDYLIKNVDLLMSMGTSALEGGKLKIPTILLDASYEEIPNDYKFKWLFNSDGSNVSQFIHSTSFENNGQSIDKIIKSVTDGQDNLGEKCFIYVKNNHNINAVSNKLLAGVTKASFTWGDINPQLLKKNKIREIYDHYRYK